MKKEPKKIYVEHPRYGSKPIPSGHNMYKSQIENGHWRYLTLKYFPETAIPADTEKQNYSVFPRSVYVDIEEQCEVCKRYFIFFAQKQKYWFEELGFWVDSHCTRCIECRKKDQELRKLHTKYQKLVTSQQRTKEETEELKEIAYELYSLGMIKNINKIKNLG